MAVGLLGQGPQPGMSSVSIIPPTTGDDYDSDGSSGTEDEQRPLTQEELKNKILKGVKNIYFRCFLLEVPHISCTDHSVYLVCSDVGLHHPMILSSDRLHLKPPKSQEDSIMISKQNKKSASTS